METEQFIDVDNSDANYVPGVCNIGPAEIRRRKQSFFISLIGVFSVSTAYLLGSFSTPWNIISPIIVFIGVFGTAVTFFQWKERFCVAFGIMGVFNFGDLGPTEKIVENEAITKDRSKVRRIFLKSTVIGFVTTFLILIIRFITSIPSLYSI